MGQLNRDFRYYKILDFCALLVLIVLLTFFTKSIVSLMDVFGAEPYANAVAELGNFKIGK